MNHTPSLNDERRSVASCRERRVLPVPPGPINVSRRAPSIAVTPSAFDVVELVEDDSDPFSRLERHLRDSEERRDHEEVVASASDERAIDQRVMAELEQWLSAIVIDRGPVSVPRPW